MDGGTHRHDLPSRVYHKEDLHKNYVTVVEMLRINLDKRYKHNFDLSY
jgi:hypothetical protein